MLRGLNFRAAPKEQPQEAVTPLDDADDDSTSFADIKDPDDYRAIFQPKHKIGEKAQVGEISLRETKRQLVVVKR